MRDNKGMSLVEVLVTVAILAVVIVTAGAFMTTSSRSFAKGSADADVQDEAELAVNQIEDLIIDVNGGVSMTDDTAKMELVLYHAEDENGTTVYKKRTVTWYKAKIEGEGDEGDIRCNEWNMVFDDTADDYVVDGPSLYDGEQLLADHVTDFTVDLSDTVIQKGAAKDGGDLTIVRSVSIGVGCENGTGAAAYATSPIITLRNRLMLGNNAKTIFELTPTADTTFQLYISDNTVDTAVPIIDRVTEVEKNKMYNIFAMVTLGSCVNPLVDWEIEEADSLSVIDENGVLSVAEHEPNQYLTITARYKTDPNKKATGVVKVLGDPKTLGVKIYTKSLVPFSPKYGSFLKQETIDSYTEEEITRLEYKWTISEPERVEPGFVDDKKDFEFVIKREEQNFGKYFTIVLTVTSPDTGQSASDSVIYRIDNNYNIGGDNCMMRGYEDVWTNQPGYGGLAWFSFIPPFWTEDITYDYYFCDAYGNEISAYDNLRQYVQIKVQHGSYWLTFTKDLPPDRTFYLKVIVHYHNMFYYVDEKDGTLLEDKDMERIHEISAVQIQGQTTHVHNATVNSGFEFEYKLVGYYALAWNREPAAYEYSVEELVYDAPAGVTVTCVPGQTEARQNEQVWARATFECSNWYAAGSVTLKSAKIKVSVKDYPNIYGYVTVIFD